MIISSIIYMMDNCKITKYNELMSLNAIRKPKVCDTGL